MDPAAKRKLSPGIQWGSAVILLLAGSALAAGGIRGQVPASADAGKELQETLHHAIAEISSPHSLTEYDYVMTARVRLLLFWASKDDVGGGYIREGASPEDRAMQLYQIVMGSDPAKTPMAINRWGAAWELMHRVPQNRSLDRNTFVGFMKASKGTSVGEMQKELAHEKEGGNFLFSAIVNQADAHANFAKEVPFASERDFTIHQLDEAAPVVFGRLADSEGKLKSVDYGMVTRCGRPEGFISTVAELIGDALSGARTQTSLCYFYDGEEDRLVLERVTPVPEEAFQVTLDQKADAKQPAQNGVSEGGPAQTPAQAAQRYSHTYRDLLRLRFENVNDNTHRRASFELLVGTQGALRGIPVRISYQPNWWFQVILNLKAPEDGERVTVSSY